MWISLYQWAAKRWTWPIQWRVIPVVALSVAVLQPAWTLLEVAGIEGSPRMLFTFLGSVAVRTFPIYVLTRPAMRWALLYAAVDQYIKKQYTPNAKVPRYILNSGNGGAIAAGMVAKAIGRHASTKDCSREPSVFVLDLFTRPPQKPDIGTRCEKVEVDLEESLIVVSFVDAGRVLRAILKRFGANASTKVFSLLIDDSGEKWETCVVEYLAKGKPSFLPFWYREKWYEIGIG